MIKLFTTILYTPMFNFLVFLMAIMPGHELGWAIIILTLIIRIVLLPVTVHTARVQVRMRLLQPKIDELRAKHKEDKALQSQALMALYKEEGVSPFSSCLPMIVQLVILVVLYQVFRNGLTTAHFDQLYSFTLRPSDVNTNFFGINLAKPDLYILPIIAGLTQYWQTKVTFIPNNNPDDPTAAFSKQMIYLAPLITLIIARSLPAALPLYWAVTNLFGVAQQQYVLKKQGLTLQELQKEATRTEKTIDKAEKTTSSAPTSSAPVKVEKKKGGVTVTVKKK
ncbi:MAG: YidC/Oxa1 family membrane protein insertase [Patescibacteria group bacterium]|jgi:YidC/Oxa1 family membrane protein insertase